MDNPLIEIADLRTLAQQATEALNGVPEAHGWTQATLRLAYREDGGGRIMEVWVRTGGKSVSVGGVYSAVRQLCKQIWNNHTGERFYGIVMTLTPAGDVDVKLNYDPGCYTDPNFFSPV